MAVANRDSNNLSILLGNGTVGFGAPAHFPTVRTPQSITAGDFNGDGILDMATSNADVNLPNDNTRSLRVAAATQK